MEGHCQAASPGSTGLGPLPAVNWQSRSTHCPPPTPALPSSVIPGGHPARAPAPNKSRQHCDSERSSPHLNPGRGAVGRGKSSDFCPNPTKPRPCWPDVLCVESEPCVCLKFPRQLFAAKQECNRKINQCLMASGNPGGHNYVASTC